MNDLISLAQKIGLQPAISGSGGHASTFSALCWAWRNSSNVGDVTALAEWYNATLCNPAWRDNELSYKINSAYKTVTAAGELGKYEPKHPRDATAYHAPYTPTSAPVAQKPPPNLSSPATGCHDALLQGNYSPSSEYLAARGITTPTVTNYRLGGCRDARFGFGVTMPYTNRAGVVTAVNRRWLSPPADGEKTRFVKDSKVGGAVFGGHLPPTPIIGIVEGEINAASVYQVSGHSCYGIGSESNWRNLDTLQWLKALASGARKVLIWLDKDYLSAALMQELGGKCLAVSSEKAGRAVGEKGKLDANDLLRHGALQHLLAMLGVLESPVAAQNVVETPVAIDNVVVADNVTESPVAESAIEDAVTFDDYSKYFAKVKKWIAKENPDESELEAGVNHLLKTVPASDKLYNLVEAIQFEFLEKVCRLPPDCPDWNLQIALWAECRAKGGIPPLPTDHEWLAWLEKHLKNSLEESNAEYERIWIDCCFAECR